MISSTGGEDEVDFDAKAFWSSFLLVLMVGMMMVVIGMMVVVVVIMGMTASL